MLKEFSLITGKKSKSFESMWLITEEKILKYAELEEKRKIKSLVKQYKSKPTEDAPGKITFPGCVIINSLLF